MRCYKVCGGGVVRYAATQAEAKDFKRSIADDTGVSPKTVLVEQTDVPTDKPGLLSFINALMEEGTAVEAPTHEDEKEGSVEDTRASARRRRRRD